MASNNRNRFRSTLSIFIYLMSFISCALLSVIHLHDTMTKPFPARALKRGTTRTPGDHMPQAPQPPRRAGPALCRGASLVAAACAAISLASIMLLMLADVGARYLFNAPVPGAA